ncbi:polysaccharide biosynthesis C-terminal domain-containing protein, partial [Vibrio parahaemolyticus]|nr:polysaccharide biosynthesis C-terminal domain-containing protein [Vibrio parahaemolyticus]
FGGCLKLVLNYILMPYFGAKGAAIATLVALIVISVLNSMLLMRAVSESLIDKRNMLGVVISGIGMGFVLIMFMRVLQMSGLVIDTEHRGIATLEALLGVAIGGLAYMFLILKLRVFTKAEIGTVMKKEKKEGSLKKSG